MKFTARVLAAALPALLVAMAAQAQTAANVLLVVNDSSADSVKIGAHYAKARAIPDDQVLHIKIQPVDTVPRIAYDQLIEQPIRNWMAKRNGYDRILYIVLTKGVPLRVDGTIGRAGTVASVDSELALVYRKLVGAPVAPQGQIPNPYYLGDEPLKNAKRFSHREHDIFLVTRLDGYTAADAIALIDRGLKAAPAGDVVLDQKADLPPAAGENWLKNAATALAADGFTDRTVLETTTRPFDGKQPVIGYYSWGSNDPMLRARNVGLNFAPGAIAAMFVSSDARTFNEPPLGWSAGDSRDLNRMYAGSSQSLTGDLIRSGVTGAAGYVTEPFGDGVIRPDVLLPAYVAGFNLAEAYYLATPYLSWQSVVVGDPLCSPFAARRAGTDEIVQPGLDPATELPTFFAARRLKNVERSAAKAEALTLWLRGEARLARGDKPGAREALAQAVAIDARLVRVHHLLAGMQEEASSYDEAITTYRTILAEEPNDPLALNNLAFALAVRKKDPVQALPLARRAYELLKAVETADTLGWVLHLTGDSIGAAVVFADVVRASVGDPEILLHSATVYAAAGRPDVAIRELARALAIDKKLETREDVKTLRARLSRGASEGVPTPR